VCFQDKNDPTRSQDGNQGRAVEGSKHGVRINFSFGYFRVVQALPLQSLNTQLENTVNEVILLRYFQGAARYRARNIRRSIKLNSSYFGNITRW